MILLVALLFQGSFAIAFGYYPDFGGIFHDHKFPYSIYHDEFFPDHDDFDISEGDYFNYDVSLPEIPDVSNIPSVTPNTNPNTNNPNQPRGCGTPPASCPPTRYRSIDGSCNNLRNPVLGTPITPYTRLLPPNYGDGIENPTLSRSGNQLPGARIVSLTIYPDFRVEDPIFTLNAMQYGQIITHDMSMVLGSTQAQPHQTRCCTDSGQLLELANSPDHCFPIMIPDDDPYLARNNIKCENFVRTITDRDRQCVGGSQPAEQLTAVNHYLDLSIVYGNTLDVHQQVRLFQGGRMRVEVRRGRQWPPRSLNASGICNLQRATDACYLAGDARANQNPQLTLLQIVLLREHNRIADILGNLNPHWGDERIFQEARKINIAQHQHISYYEWLPIFIGVGHCFKHRIVWPSGGFVNDYNENVNPTVLNEHATAAFRYFHSLIAGNLQLITESRLSRGGLRLSDYFNRPQVLEDNDNFDDLARGLNTQPQLASDPWHDSEITQFLFRTQQQFGSDLKAADIQRNRDHGLASYNDYREFCDLPRAHIFDDFSDLISRENVEKLATLYETPNDVDLTVGASLEAHEPGTLVGPTFLCILTEQFYRTRVGDRFWFENGGETGFTIEQLTEIRKASISRLLCDNGHNIKAMQPRGFEKISPSNEVVPCNSLPAVDLSLWREHRDIGGSYQGPFALPPSLFFK